MGKGVIQIRMLPTRLITRKVILIRGFHSTFLLSNKASGTPVELDIVNKLRQTGAQTTKHLTKDYSLLKLGAWIVIFGSMLTNVIDKKQQYEEMEEKYSLKIEILKDIISKLRNGEDVNVEDELRLVNQTLERRKLPRYKSPLRRKKSQIAEDIPPVEEESLEDLWKEILNDTSETDSATAKNIGTPTRVVSDNNTDNDDIMRDKRALLMISKQEEIEQKYFTPTDQHVVVNKPGYVTEAARDTKMTKYL